MNTVKLRSLAVRLVRGTALIAIAGGLMAGWAAVTPAAAWWHGGFFVGVAPAPLYVGPPVAYPPPVYYASPPPPVYYPPPSPPAWYTPPPAATAAPPAPTGQSCFAGAYVCPMDHPVPSGSACYCLSNERSKVWGRAS